jgi:hypothetical protein
VAKWALAAMDQEEILSGSTRNHIVDAADADSDTSDDAHDVVVAGKEAHNIDEQDVQNVQQDTPARMISMEIDLMDEIQADISLDEM